MCRRVAELERGTGVTLDLAVENTVHGYILKLRLRTGFFLVLGQGNTWTVL